MSLTTCKIKSCWGDAYAAGYCDRHAGSHIVELEVEIERLRREYEELKLSLNRWKQWAHEVDAKNLEYKAENQRLRTAMKPVYANASNTTSVRKGYEMGGYIKYYKVSTNDYREALLEDK